MIGRDYGCGYRHRHTHHLDPLEDILRSPCNTFIDDEEEDEDYGTLRTEDEDHE